MKSYIVEVDCGETTCAKAKGEFCNHLGVKNFGTTPVCTLFQNEWKLQAFTRPTALV